jgi:hypothetical protein
MSQFDLIFEETYRSLLREKQYIDSTFADNVRLLVKALQENDYISPNKPLDVFVDNVLRQNKNTKEIVLDPTEKAFPPIKLLVKQGSSGSLDSTSEDFSVTVVNLKDPSTQKEFTNSMLETIFNDVIEHIKTISLQGLSPEAAVDTLPPEEGANAQPGGGNSALPNV